MRDYLIFQLYGPMSAWGDIAVGETRRSNTHPSKSAIFGILAASMGIDRQNEEIHVAMAKSYCMAQKVLSIGSLLVDYHTVQAPPQRRNVKYRTRRDELAEDKLGTLLSSREYRCDAAYIVAVWIENGSATYTLQQMADSLAKPEYTIYLGRKSCPAAYPLNPEIVTTQSLKKALDSRDAFAKDFAGISRDQAPMYYWDDTPVSDLDVEQRFERWDVLRSRRRWQFHPRVENFCVGKKEA